MFSLEVTIFLFNSNKIVCLFGVFRPTQYSYPIHSYEDVTITGEELNILKYAFELWPFSSEGPSVWHTYCDTGHLFMIVISDDPWHSHLLLSVLQSRYHYLFLCGWDSNTQPSVCKVNALTDCVIAAVSMRSIVSYKNVTYLKYVDLSIYSVYTRIFRLLFFLNIFQWEIGCTLEIKSIQTSKRRRVKSNYHV